MAHNVFIFIHRNTKNPKKLHKTHESDHCGHLEDKVD